MRTRPAPRRGGFTLIEMLVGLAVLIVLTSIAVVVVDTAMTQDRTTDGANSLRQYLMIAKARAARDQLPRGVRLLVPANRLVTELQYTEVPPPWTPPRPFGTPPPDYYSTSDPYVEFEYTHTSGAITGRQCYLGNLPADVVTQINSDIANQQYPYLMFPPDSIPSMAPLARITAPLGPPVGGRRLATLSPTPTASSAGAYPDLGAATVSRTFLFGVKFAPRPLVGEPTQLLPKNICVDLNVSQPVPSATEVTAGAYDITFRPDGQVMDRGEGQIFLWVRDSQKNGGQLTAASFQEGGEQQVLALKAKSGALGTFPIAWDTTDPFQFARRGASALAP